MDRKWHPANRAFSDQVSDEVNRILATPAYKRGDLVRNTVPQVDQNIIDNWLRRGWLDLTSHMVVGGAKHFRKMADLIEANEATGTHRRYTGSDILKVMTLQVIGQAGLSFKLAPDIIDAVLHRAVAVLLDPDHEDHAILAIAPDGEGGYALHACQPAELSSLETDWLAVIDIDRIINRFLASGMGRKTSPDPLVRVEQGEK